MKSVSTLFKVILSPHIDCRITCRVNLTFSSRAIQARPAPSTAGNSLRSHSFITVWGHPWRI